MKRTLYFLVIISLSMVHGVATAQTEDVQSALRYRFVKGKQYVYRSVFRQIDETETSGEYIGDSFVHSMSLTVCVKDVDSAGNAELVFAVSQECYAEVEGRDARSLSQGIRPEMEPKFRARVSPFGRAFDGEVLEESAHSKAFREKMKTPGFQGWKRPDSSIVRFYVGKIFPPLPPAESSRPPGETDGASIVFACVWVNDLGMEVESVLRETVDSAHTAILELETLPRGGNMSVTNPAYGGVFKVDFTHYSMLTRFRKSDGALLEWNLNERTERGQRPERHKFEFRITLIHEGTCSE